MKLKKTELETNWKNKNLENLEKDFWGEPTYDSHVVKTCHELRKKTLKDFETEDLRIMISQNIGLKFLIPLALRILKVNILVEGDFYEGDLLNAVLTSNNEFWSEEKELIKELAAIISENQEVLKEREPKLLELFKEWKK